MAKRIPAAIEDLLNQRRNARRGGVAANRLRGSSAKSRVVVLVTDGINNRGAVDPVTAAQMAKALGIHLYTVGVGTRGAAPIPVQTAMGTQLIYEQVPLDEAGLRRIADVVKPQPRTIGGSR